MATDKPTQPPHPFDVKTVEYLISLMAQHELSEISLAEGEQRIRLRKGQLAPTTYMPAAMPQPAPATQAPSVNAAVDAPAAAPTKKLLEITSPMVGTFYAKPSPDKPDYVSVGSTVSATTVVCKLEAMKIFNDINAEVSGKIAEICVKNGQPVDFGMVLFRVDPS